MEERNMGRNGLELDWNWIEIGIEIGIETTKIDWNKRNAPKRTEIGIERFWVSIPFGPK